MSPSAYPEPPVITPEVHAGLAVATLGAALWQLQELVDVLSFLVPGVSKCPTIRAPTHGRFFYKDDDNGNKKNGRSRPNAHCVPGTAKPCARVT